MSWNGVQTYKDIDRTKPLPPNNIFVTNPYIPGTLDIRWDNPLEVSDNTQWTILGVNIYRSEDSEGGPYHKINTTPIETLSYRDQTNNSVVVDEDVLPRLHAGTNSVGEWVFTTLMKPIVKQNSQNVLADASADVILRIDNSDGQGLLTVPARNVRGRTGEVFLITQQSYNPVTKKLDPARLPLGPNAKCYCSYFYNTNLIRNDLYPRFFYKITTVGRDKFGVVSETNVNELRGANVFQIEKPHYIWKSIIVKNRYLLEQFGERVKLFIRKEVGERCVNYSDTHQQAHNDCKLCFGTGIVGGYLGPIDILVAPPEAEKHIDLLDTGLRMNFTYDSWTGPSPLLRTRDFIVRQNGERLSIGPVTPQGAKGAVFQQHFNLNYRDSKDIIYQVPIFGGELSVPVSEDTRSVNSPVVDASPTIPAYKSERADTDKGRTIDYENVTW